MSSSKEKILITGGLWYIGSHTAVAFWEAGYDIVIIDNLSNAHKSVVERIGKLSGKKPIFYNADLKDKEAVKKIFKEHPDISWVIHFAAKKSVGESCEDPFLYYENNIIGSINLFKAMQEANIKNIVFSSSATVYDAAKLLPPFSEMDRLNTVNPYWTTKLVMEYLLKDLSSYKYFNTVCLRYFNPIGAHHSWMIGENPKWVPSNLVPYVLKVAKGEIEHVKIYGNDYETEDGTGIRDYIHVMDVAEAHLWAFNHIKESVEYQKNTDKVTWLYDIFNIGTGDGKSVKEIIDLVQKVTEKEIPCKIVGRRAGDIDVSIANPQKAKQILWWEYKRSIYQAIEDWWRFVNNKIEE